MSLRASERRRLARIQGALDRSDPELVSLFATFSRLTREEAMPAVERLRVWVDRLTLRGRVFRMAVLRRLRLVLIAPVALAAAAAPLLITVWSSSPGTCKAATAAYSAGRRPVALPRLAFCPAMPWRPAMAGR